MTQSIVYKTEETGSVDPSKELNAEGDTKKPVEGAPAAEGGERPAWLPEKFKTVEDFVKSSEDTRAELTRTQQELAKSKKPEGDKKPEGKDGEKPEGETAEQKLAREALEKSGVDNTPFQKEFDDTGDLSAESRAKAAEAYGPFIKQVLGAEVDPTDIINRWIEGQNLRTNNYQGEIFKTAGGEDAYAEMTAWAKTNYNDAEKQAFNAAVKGGDVNAARQAVDGLNSRYSKANGKQPNLLGGKGGNGAEAGFASTFEMQKAISDPRYAKDPVYRKSVEQRIGKSNF